jgi:hypothetical protein
LLEERFAQILRSTAMKSWDADEPYRAPKRPIQFPCQSAAAPANSAAVRRGRVNPITLIHKKFSTTEGRLPETEKGFSLPAGKYDRREKAAWTRPDAISRSV